MTPRLARNLRRQYRSSLEGFARLQGRTLARIHHSRHLILLSRRALANGK